MNKPFISFAILILTAAFTFFYVVPAYNLNKSRRVDVESLLKVLNKSVEIRALIDKTKKNLDEIDPSGIERFAVFLPEKIDPIRFANNIQQVGIKNRILLSSIKVEGPQGGVGGHVTTVSSDVSAIQGLVNAVSIGSKINQVQNMGIVGVQSTSVTEPDQEKKYVTTKATLTFTATYDIFQSFLEDLEKSLGLIDLVSLKFTLSPERVEAVKPKIPREPTYQYEMVIETYSLK